MKSLELFANGKNAKYLMEGLNQYAEETNMEDDQYDRLAELITTFILNQREREEDEAEQLLCEEEMTYKLSM
jgi:hypothetical protein